LQAAAQRSPMPLDHAAGDAGAGASSMIFWWRPLHRAVALAEPDRVLVLVGEDLDLDVARVLEELLQIDRRIAERRAGLGPGGLHRRQQRRFGVDDPHAAARRRRRRLDDDRVADLAGRLDRFLRVVGRAPSEPGTHGTPDLIMACLADTLSPIRPDRFGVGPMKVKPLRSTRSAKSAFSERKP
jgi:hypothetical protein